MRLTSFLLLALVTSMILTNLPLEGFADPQLDSLLRIAVQARDNIKIRMSQISTLPDEILRLYNQGSSETDALAQSVSQGDISASRQHFLSAMQLFKQVSDKLSSSTPSGGTEALPAQAASRLRNAISEVEKTAERLKTIATNNNVEIDFAEFDKLIQAARQSLEKGNAAEVTKALKTANQFILDAHHMIAEAAKQKAADRAKDFTAKQIERVDKLMTQAKDLGVSENITDTLSATKKKLQETSDTGQIAVEVKDINTIKEKLEASNIERLNTIVHQLEIKLESISGVQDENSKAKIANAKDMIAELKKLVSDRKFDDVPQMIKSIEMILEDISSSRVTMNETTTPAQPTVNETKNTRKAEPTVNETSSVSTTPLDETKSIAKKGTNNEKINKATDKRLERVQQKIQSLEEEISRLSEKANGSDAATQLLKRAASLIDDAKSQLENSIDKATNTLNQAEKIVQMVQRMVKTAK